MPKKLLFICLGNICRSPAAEGIARKIFPKDWEIDSAGTGGWHTGDSPDPRSIEVCKNHGIDISMLKARPVRIADDEYFDFLIAMDEQNVRDLKRIFPQKNHHKIIMLDEISVADPYYGGDNGFEIMYQHIEKSLKKLVTKL